MRALVRSLALAAAVLPSSAIAQTVTLTESQALGRLDTSSPRVQAARAGIEVARADVLAAGRLPNPRVNWDRQSVAGITEHYFNVTQVLPITGRRRFAIDAASALVDARTSRADDEVRRLRTDLRLAFADLLAAQTRERELASARDRLRDMAALLARRENAGESAGFDRLRAEREVFDVETDLVVAATERARAQATLASFFSDVADPTQIVALPTVTDDEPVPPVAALLEQAEGARGELRALKQEAEAARLSARAAERSRIPEPEIIAGTKSSTAGGVGVGSTITIGGQDIGPVIGVHATLPLFDRGRPELASAAARSDEAEARAAAFRVVLRGQLATLRDAVLQRRSAADRYRKDAVGSAAEMERIAQVSYEAGERGILELLDAYRIGTSARVRQAALDLAVREAEIELAFVSGLESL